VSYLITFDADGQHDITDAATLIDTADNNSKLGAVFGSRFIEDTGTNVPMIRRAILFMGRFFTLIVSGVYLTDTHN
jgi:polyprenyl-phospho-N-acetylgalactosaminyl synthase